MARCRLPMTLSKNKQLGDLLLDTVLFTKDLNTMLDTLHWFLACSKYAQFTVLRCRHTKTGVIVEGSV